MKETIEKNGAVTAYFETSCNTIRHIKCHFLTKGMSRCCHCSHYRATLRAMLSRAKKSSHDMSSEMSSHTNYRYLQPDTLKLRLKNFMKSKRTADRNILRLNEKLQSLIHDEGIELVEEDASDIGQLIADIDGASKQQSANSHFQKIFWDQQSKYTSCVGRALLEAVKEEIPLSVIGDITIKAIKLNSPPTMVLKLYNSLLVTCTCEEITQLVHI